MNISDLEHLEVVSKKTHLVGGTFAVSEAESYAVAKGEKTNTVTTAKTFSKTFEFYPHR